MNTRMLFFIFCGFFSCQNPQQNPQLEADQTLQKKVEEEIRSQSKVNFVELTDFEWDEMITLGPYSQVEKVADSLNLNLSNIKNNGISGSDSFTLVVFLQNKKSVRIIEPAKRFNRSAVIIPKNESNFKINEDGILSITN